MPTPAPSKEQLEKAISIVREIGVTKAARTLGMPRTTLSTWVQEAKALGMYERVVDIGPNPLQAINDSFQSVVWNAVGHCASFSSC